MRALRRWLRHRRAEHRIAPRRRALEAALALHFGGPVRLEPAGAAGRDSIYRVRAGHEVRAMARLVNPARARAHPPPDSPFAWLDAPARLEREWRAYAAGAPHGLTPTPLWRGDDAIVCALVPGQRLSEHLARSPDAFWTLHCAATRAIGRLHRAGLLHMDTCLANLIADREIEESVFIDFEYAPAPWLGEPEARAYDYLRLLESGMKFLPAAGAAGVGDWLAALDASLDPATREADVDCLAPALGRLFAAGPLRDAVKVAFPRLSAG